MRGEKKIERERKRERIEKDRGEVDERRGLWGLRRSV
jgi:hypothetical protein